MAREEVGSSDTYLLHAVLDASDLAALPLPEGWRYAPRTLDAELVVDSGGYPHVYRDARGEPLAEGRLTPRKLRTEASS